MTCPPVEQWDLLSMNLLEEAAATELLQHAQECAACRSALAQARRDDTALRRACEAFDRDHELLRDQIMAVLPAQAPRPVPAGWLVRGWHRLGDAAMSLNKSTTRRAVIVLAPAACLAIALLIVFSTPKSAFASAVAYLRQMKSFACRVSMPEGLEIQGVKIYSEGKLQFSEQYGSHCEMYMNGALITQQYAPPSGPMLLVQPPTRTYMKLEVGQMAFLDMPQQSPEAFLMALRTLADETATELGKETIDGRLAVGYRIPGTRLGFPESRDPAAPSAYAELWVDTSTKRPVKFMGCVPLPAQGSTLKMVYDRFEWDVPLEAAVFEPNLPADYVEVDARLARPTEDALMNALRRIAQLTGGRYPMSFDAVSVLAELHPMLTKEGLAELDRLGRAGIMQLGIEIGGGAMYYMKLVREGHEPEYFGADVTAADADQVLLQWKLDNGQMRVVYGDLRVETRPQR